MNFSFLCFGQQRSPRWAWRPTTVRVSICSVLSFILSCTQKLCNCATSPMQKKKGPGMKGNTEEMLKHCIFNKPCQSCSELTACKQCAQPTVCILNMSNKLCAGMWLLHSLETGHLIQIMHGRATQTCAAHSPLQMIDEGGVCKGHMGCEPIISARAAYEPVNEPKVENNVMSSGVNTLRNNTA